MIPQGELDTLVSELRVLMSRNAAGAENLRDRAIRAIVGLVEELHQQREVEARERALYLKQIAELEAMVYHTPPGQLEYAPEGWTWRQEAMDATFRATGKTAPLGGCE